VHNGIVPPKIRQLIQSLEKAGFTNRGGKGSHRNFVKGRTTIVVSGKLGDDAKKYQERDVKRAIEVEK
jgi:predicted RNA binding protein YcfA (HicA-like mRNA interferase family)